jgi:hypothetical protein
LTTTMLLLNIFRNNGCTNDKAKMIMRPSLYLTPLLPFRRLCLVEMDLYIGPH